MTFRLRTSTALTGLVLLSSSLFGSIQAHGEDFKQALISAYQHNPRLLAERARVREIDENYVQAQAAGRFTVGVNASYGRNVQGNTQTSFFGGASRTTTWLTPRTGQLSIVQPLYQGGRVKGLKAQAKAGILAARQGLRNAEQNLLLSAATAYLDVLRDEETAKIRRNNVLVLTRQKFAAQDRFEVGAGTRTDIAQAEARLAQAEIGLAQAEAQLAISRAAYKRYIGHAPESLTKPPQFVLPPSLQSALETGRANNPQLVAARYNENAAQSAIAVAKAAGRPNLSLNATFGDSADTSTFITKSQSASITAQLRIPLYSGGLNSSRVRAAKQARIRSRFETREAELAVDQSIANLWAQVTAFRRTLEGARQQVKSAEIAFEGVQLEQQVGTRDTLDVLNAEQELLDARLAVVQAERNLNVVTYQLLVTMGGFDAWSLQLPVDLYNPEDNFNAVTKNRIGKYIPDPVEDALGAVPDKISTSYELVTHKVPKDLKDLANGLLPDPVSADKIGKDLSNLGKAITPAPVVNGAGTLVGQIPDAAKSGLKGVAIDDPFDPDARPADPEDIDPKPILIRAKETSSGKN